MAFLAQWVLLLVFATPFGAAKITKAEISKDDRAVILLSKPFGFADNGFMDFTITNVVLHVVKRTDSQEDVDYKNFGLYLLSSSAEEIAEDPSYTFTDGNTCAYHDRPDFKKLITFNNAKIKEMIDSPSDKDLAFSHHVRQTDLGNGGVKSLLFVNCEDHVLVGFDITINMYNIDSSGRKNYLSVGEIELPTMYLIMFIVFTVGLGMWGYYLHLNRAHAHRIHYLMAVLGLFKVLTLLAQCGMYHYVRVTGTPDGWNIAYYIFTLFRGVFLFSVIILIGTGWSYMTPYLGDNNRKILMLVIPLQVFAEVAIIVLDEFTPATRSWFTWRDIMHLFDIVCCAAIIFPIVWRIKHLREAAMTDGKAEKSLQQLVMFRHFYIMVLSYIYFTRIVVFILKATLPFQYSWLSSAAEEIATLVFYTLTAMQFKPHNGGGYFRFLSDSDIEMAPLV